MPTVTELVLTFLSCLGIAVLVSEKGERVWAVFVAAVVWLMLEFSFVMIGVWAEAAGWFTR